MLVRLRAEVQEVPRGLTAERPRRPIRDLAAIGIAAAVGAVLVLGYGWYRVWDQGARDDARPAGAIVVLGAAQYDGRPSPVFAARLDHALELYKQGLAPYLVVTGGKRDGDRSTEAAAARRYALERGVPADAILSEDQGRTTLASLEAVGRVLREHGVRDAVFVSDPTHMLRVLRIAEDTGIRAWGSPTRTSPIERDTGRKVDATLHELGALALYYIAGQAPASDTSSQAGAGDQARSPITSDARP
jgi:uncharacterized SAM-binding protein YcdF (DUF218 family)